MEKAYAAAIEKAVERGLSPQEVAARVRDVLQRRGHMKLLPRIANSLRARARAGEGAQPVLVVADERDAASARAEALKIDARAEGAAIATDSTQIGGWIFRAGSERVDASYRTQLLRLYHAIIAQ